MLSLRVEFQIGSQIFALMVVPPFQHEPQIQKPRNDVLLLFFASLDIYDRRSDFDFPPTF